MVDRIGKFRLGRVLGSGGMGDIFEAWADGEATPVALKVLAERASTQRFREEMRLGQTLRHPHLVPVLESGEEGTVHWFTMPLLQGCSLAELRRHKPGGWPEGLVLSLLDQSLDALAYLHAHGVIHRDVKPSNLFLRTDGSLFLIDYGIARASDTDLTVTRSGQVLGSLRYLSPEQARGTGVDSRTDLFSLGLVAHELLSGEKVFPQEDNLAAVTALLMEPVASLSELRSGLSDETTGEVMRLLEKEPTRRPATAEQLRSEWKGLRARGWTADDVRTWFATSGAAEARAGTAELSSRVLASATARAAEVRVETPSSRRRWVVGSLLALLVAGGAAAWVLRPRTYRETIFVRPGQLTPPPQVVVTSPTEPTPRPTPVPTPPVTTPRVTGTGFLTLDVRPGWATVYVDGVKRGATPLFRAALKAGSHEVELVRSGGQKKRLTLAIRKGQETTRVVRW